MTMNCTSVNATQTEINRYSELVTMRMLVGHCKVVSMLGSGMYIGRNLSSLQIEGAKTWIDIDREETHGDGL